MSKLQVRVVDNIEGRINRMEVEGATIGDVISSVVSGLSDKDVSITFNSTPVSDVDESAPAPAECSVGIMPKKVEGGRA